MIRVPDRGVLLILLLAFAVRAAAVLTLGTRDPGPDAVDDYLPLAASVLAGEGFINGAGEPDYVRGPGYPLFLVAVRLITGSDGIPAILWTQAILDTWIVALVFWIAGRVFGPPAARWAGGLYALNPLAVYACALAGPETLFAFLLTLALAALYLGIESSRWWAFVCSGLVLGFCVLTRATPALLVPVWGGWLVWLAWRGAKPQTCVHLHGGMPEDCDTPVTLSVARRLTRGVGQAVLLGVAAVAVVLPWTYRNARVFGEFIPVVCNGGSNLYAGSSDRFWPPPPEHHLQRDLRMQELIDAGAVPAGPAPGAGPAVGDAYMRQLALANYRAAWEESPAEVLTYLVRKSLRLWYATHSGRQERFVGGINVIWLGLAVCGLAVALRQGRFTALTPCLLTIAYFPVVLIAMFPLARYVVGFAPCLCVAGGAACLIVQQALTRWFVRTSQTWNVTQAAPRAG